MLSKVDLRDFFEINKGLYGDSRLHAEQIDWIGALLCLLEAKRRDGFDNGEPRNAD